MTTGMAPQDLAPGPGLSFVRGGEGRGKSRLLAQLKAQAETAGRSVWLEQPAEAQHDQVVARAWLAQRRGADWSPAVEAALVEAFALVEHLDKPLYMLSAGSRRKLGLVGAAASGAALTLLETPYAALDARSARLLTELLAEAAEGRERAWVLADYELPPGLAGLPLAATLDLGD
jgi:ATPase subunit of ABC transporter with duplicated ATPase domains